MAGAYTRDWWLWPITITDAENDGLVLTESGGSTFTINLDGGTYYTHRDSGIDSDYPSLYLAIENELSAEATTNTYTFEVATPTESVDQLTAGVRLVGTAGTSVDFSLDFSDVSFTLDPRLLGFLDTQSTDVSADAIGSDFGITSKYTVFGTWRAFSLYDGQAAEKRGDLRTLGIDSHDRPSDRYTIEWYEEEKYRQIIYERVNAAHVYRYAARQSSYAVVGKLAQFDTHNAFYHVWRELKRDSDPCIIVHNVGDTWDLDVDGYDAEAVKRAGEFSTSFREWTGEPVKRAGEFYDLSLELYVDADIGEGYLH